MRVEKSYLGVWMFTLNIGPDLQLALVQPSFARHYLDIVTAERT